MTLKPGSWLNHYEVLAHLGTGGMGEVYRARDNKLQREVALKVLPKAFAQDPERVARFRREAQVLAQVNHVNIAAIYSVEESGGTHFLVMELAEGETLRDRIKRGPAEWVQASRPVLRQAGMPVLPGTGGPVPLDEALDIVKQIAAGLEAAHEKPIVHRDLKPANVKVTPEGVVKILDFGLARAFAGDTGSGDPADSPTLTGMTQPGTILGTAAYMSPEQARGRKVDKRTDIWALGCVLYELLTGKWVFAHPSRARQQAANPALNPSPARQGGGQASPPAGSDDPSETVADILGAVIHKDPDWSSLPASTPPNVRFVLRRCLEKDAKRRFHSATDVAIALEEPWTVAAAEAPLAAAVPPRPVWQQAVPVAVALLVGALLAGVAIWNLRAPGPRALTRFTVALPSDVALATGDLTAIAVSPDGSRLAYVGTRGGTPQLFVRALDSLEARPIEGTEGASMPFFSPDGQWLGFFAGATLKKVSISGGAAVTINASGGGAGRGASWGADDRIVFAGRSTASGLFQVSAAGGAVQELTKLEPTNREISHRWPQLLPGGKAVIFTVQRPGIAGIYDIVVQQLETGERKILVQGGAYARYVPTGHLVYVRAGTLMAAPFDLNRLEVAGPAIPVVEGVMLSRVSGGAQFSISDQGSLVYVPGGPRGTEMTLVWVDRKGVEQPLEAPPRPYASPRLSPDGRLLAIGAQGDIWINDIARSTLSRLTFDGASNYPIWSPDGKRIAFLSSREGKPANLFWKPADGSGPDERLTTSEHSQFLYSWSPDGKVIGFTDVDPTSGNDIWVLPLSGDQQQPGSEGRKPRPFLQTAFFETGAKFSPDGRWLAYVSDESGQFEVYVQPFPGPGGKWQISTGGGTEMVWARNGEIFYTNGNRLMAVETKTQPTFSAGAPRLLFEGPYERSTLTNPNYDVTADGQRFVMMKAVGQEAAPPTQIHVVLNWFEELKRRVPR